ncbi:GSCOCG00009668001-RA-CDS [Cotesia congregata]|nr:GSCOCG00009668001-RA-CDS [Cotesia congregata]
MRRRDDYCNCNPRAKNEVEFDLLKLPVHSMQQTPRSDVRVPSLDSSHPFTPSDLSSIPHMDESPTPTSNQTNNQNSTAADNTTDVTLNSGPYIVGSPIDLGNIDNVDNIGLQVGSIRRGRGRTREHIELQETGSPESELSGSFMLLS